MSATKSILNPRERIKSWRKLQKQSEQLLSRVNPLNQDDINTERLLSSDLSEDFLQDLVYVTTVEGFTAGANGYAQKTWRNPWVWLFPALRDFAIHWEKEENGHEKCLLQATNLINRTTPDSRLPDLAKDSWVRHLAMCSAGLLFFPLRRSYIAAHMAWGAINEYCAMQCYAMLIETSPNPGLNELLDKIMAQEARHYSWYLLHYKYHADKSWVARRLTAWILGKYWSPVGTSDGFRPIEEFWVLLGHISATNKFCEVFARGDNVLERQLVFSSFKPFAYMRAEAEPYINARSIH